jgi:hypothetical protein
VSLPARLPVSCVLALSVVVAGTLAACSGRGERAAPPEVGQSGSGTSEASPQPVTHPLTGRRGGANRPVLAVKIDNTRPAQPQLGLRSADIVYVEQVEGGATRIMAVFSSRLPRSVGPVRSARISDLHILRQYPSPALAYSGVQGKMKPYIARAPLYDVSPERAGGAYRRSGDRPAPYNLYAAPSALLGRAPKAGTARDIGFRFGPAPSGGKPAQRFTASYPGATFSFRWSKDQRRWLVWQDGRRDRAAEGGQLGGETIVVQYARTTRSPFRDFLGNYTPLVVTTGTGRAVVLRDGMAYEARWSRPREQDGTTFTTPAGQPMTFAPGQVWVVLVNPGKPKIP